MVGEPKVATPPDSYSHEEHERRHKLMMESSQARLRSSREHIESSRRLLERSRWHIARLRSRA